MKQQQSMHQAHLYHKQHRSSLPMWKARQQAAHTMSHSGRDSTCVFSRLGAIESISSMKMMAGAFFSASSKALRKLLSDSPASLDMISGPLMRKKNAPVSFATALAMSVLPARSAAVSRTDAQDTCLSRSTQTIHSVHCYIWLPRKL